MGETEGGSGTTTEDTEVPPNLNTDQGAEGVKAGKAFRNNKILITNGDVRFLFTGGSRSYGKKMRNHRQRDR